MNKLKRYIIAGIIFVLLTGTLSHFVYEWSGNNPLAGIFFPVNESTWEHMKLVFFPLLLYSFYMNRKLRTEYPCITSSLAWGILAGTYSIPVIFYLYTGILGYHTLALDIMTFAAGVLISFFVIYRYSLSCKTEKHAKIGKLLVSFTSICFLLFTFFPPDIGLFAG